MLENAIIYRQWRTAFRLRKLIAFLGVLAVILLTAYTSFYGRYILEPLSADRPAEVSWAELGAGMLRVVLVLEMIVCIYGALALSAESIGGERQRKTLDLLVTLPLSSGRKLHGLLIGYNLYPLLAYVLLTPLALIFGSMAGMLMPDLIIISLLLLATMVCYGLVGLAISSSTGGVLAVLGAIVLFFINSGLGSALSDHHYRQATYSNYRYNVPIEPVSRDISLQSPLLPLTPLGMGLIAMEDQHVSTYATFYGKAMPWQSAAILWLAYLGVLSYLVARQKLSRPSLPPLPRWLTLLFFLLLEALLIGFFWQEDLSSRDAAMLWPMAWLSAFFVLVLLWSLATQLSYSNLLTWTRRFGGRPWHVLSQGLRLHAPNGLATGLMWLLVGGGLWVLTSASPVGPVRQGMDRSEQQAVVIAFVSLLGFLLQANVLMLLGEIFWKRAGKFGGLVIFILLNVIPIVIGLACDSTTVASLSAEYSLALLNPTEFRSNDVIANLCASWGLFVLVSVIYLYWNLSTAWLARREETRV